MSRNQSNKNSVAWASVSKGTDTPTSSNRTSLSTLYRDSKSYYESFRFLISSRSVESLQARGDRTPSGNGEQYLLQKALLLIGIMELSISFKDGPIEAEITADETDDYEEVLEALSEFVNGYSPTVSQPEKDTTQNETITNGNTEEKESESEVETQSASTDDISTLREIPENKLQRVVKTGRVDDGDVSEHPYVISDTNILGDTETERLLHTSVLILSILDDFHDTDTMKTSELKQALADSGLNDENFGNIDKLNEAEVYLNRRGRGPSATTEIRRPGKDKTKELVANLIEDI